jgi:uncharacterized tellurite resistance protein B-like protein
MLQPSKPVSAEAGRISLTVQLGERALNLFAGLRGRGNELNLDPATAVMVPIVAAMLADGRVEEEEVLQIEAICATSPIYERNSVTDNERLINHVTRMIEDQGMEKMCRAAAQILSPALRETAFVYAAKVIFSDGYVGQIEREVMESLFTWLEIQDDRARVLVDVVSVMQHPLTA